MTDGTTSPTRTRAATRLRRSCHFVPGANEKLLTKSLATQADALILDLEDAVTPERKNDARQTVSGWLADVDFGGQERLVRINPLDTPWGVDDLESTMRHPPDAYVVPKVEHADEVSMLAERLDHWEREYGHSPGGVALILICAETPRSLLNIAELPDHPRVAGLTWGAEDLSAALGASRNRGEDGAYLPLFQNARDLTLLAAAAGGAQPIDTVYVDFKDGAGLMQDCNEAAWTGYTGKLTIHPDQIDIVNAAFSPSDADIAQAQRLIEVFADAQEAGLMAISFEGQMVDVPHLRRAEKLLDKAKQIALKGE